MPRCERLVREGFAPYFAPPAIRCERLRALERFRVLCAHRRGPGGVEAVNAQIEHLLADARRASDLDGEFYVGRPILITQNDYQLQLFNGDVGIDRRGTRERPSARVAVFVGARRQPAPHRAVAPAAARDGFAMSVHKSQGSEFDSVAVLLPRRAVAGRHARAALHRRHPRARARRAVRQPGAGRARRHPSQRARLGAARGAVG